jgi:hypothetical protein
MKEEMSIDELLSSFVDGELTTRQETEVRRLIENDPQIAQRVQQLQKCKILMCSLPVAKAPVGMLDDIKTSMETGTRQDRPFAFKNHAETKHLPLRRMAAIAAMIGFVSILSAVVFTIAPPDTTPEGVDGIIGPSVADTTDFNGKLEFKTKELNAVDSFVTRTIEDDGYTDFLSPSQDANRRVYIISCSKEGLNRLLADFDNIWNKLDSATLFVKTGDLSDQVVVNAVTTKQIAEIANQNNTDRSIEVAKDYSVLNGVAQELPGRDIFSAIEDQTNSLMKINKPNLTQKIIEKPDFQDDGQKTIHLTIIVSK